MNLGGRQQGSPPVRSPRSASAEDAREETVARVFAGRHAQFDGNTRCTATDEKYKQVKISFGPFKNTHIEWYVYSCSRRLTAFRTSPVWSELMCS